MTPLQHDQLYLQARRVGAQQTAAAIVRMRTSVCYAIGDLTRLALRAMFGRLAA